MNFKLLMGVRMDLVGNELKFYDRKGLGGKGQNFNGRQYISGGQPFIHCGYRTRQTVYETLEILD